MIILIDNYDSFCYNLYQMIQEETASPVEVYRNDALTFEQIKEKKPQKVVFRSNLVGTTYPMRQVNHDELRLRGFKWLEDLRPKTKYELFAN